SGVCSSDLFLPEIDALFHITMLFLRSQEKQVKKPVDQIDPQAFPYFTKENLPSHGRAAMGAELGGANLAADGAYTALLGLFLGHGLVPAGLQLNNLLLGRLYSGYQICHGIRHLVAVFTDKPLADGTVVFIHFPLLRQ